ncbi:MAG: hypothetical protein BGO98_40735 [Myxococcales bacterium 68-20]|nr:MAG: hypothetical protein BGO98_40735 [Myxococcales bacterium 68-20]
MLELGEHARAFALSCSFRPRIPGDPTLEPTHRSAGVGSSAQLERGESRARTCSTSRRASSSLCFGARRSAIPASAELLLAKNVELARPKLDARPSRSCSEGERRAGASSEARRSCASLVLGG